MAGWLESVLSDTGYVGLVLLMIAENVFPPIPSEVVLPFAGYLVGQGELSFAGAVAFATVGSVLGALPLYALGRWFGPDGARRLADRHGHWLTIDRDDIDRADSWFQKHARTAVLVGRLVPAIRSVISIPAGMARMPLPSFLLFTTLGTLGWDLLLVSLGWWLGERYSSISTWLGPVTWVIVGGAFVWYVVRLVRQKRAASQH